MWLASGAYVLSTRDNVYDSPTREIHLLENLAIQGRKTELRQLLKLLNMAKSGQPKAALVTGDAGIGKTALLEALVDVVREGVYCRILNVGRMESPTPEALYVALMDTLVREADGILDEALAAVNEIIRDLDLRWDRRQLGKAISVVRLQETAGGPEAISREQLVKSIRSQVPAVKKLKLSVNDSIERLVDLIVNPWVLVASAIQNPMHPALQEALDVAARLKSGQEPVTPLPVAHPEPSPASEDDPELVNASEAIIHLQAQPVANLPAVLEPDPDLPDFPPVPAYPVAMHLEPTVKPIRNPLVKHLMNVFRFVNGAIQTLDTGMLVLIDEWDRIQTLPEREALKEFLNELLYQMGEQKDFHFMTVVSARNEGESYTLGGTLFNQFRTKLLLDPLNEAQCRKLIRTPLQQVNATADEDVNRRVYALSKGNPYWHLKIVHYLKERVESNRVCFVDTPFFDKLGIEDPQSTMELGFTRLKLAFLNDENALHKAIAALLKQFGERVFSAGEAIREISISQGMADGYVFEVLRGLYRHDFIRQLPAGKDGEKGDPRYALQSRFAYEFLVDKTRAIETDISTDEKLGYLKRIIPLSVKSGELDREKTREVIALSDAMGKREMVDFLEGVFLEALGDDKPVVRVTALNNLAMIDSAAAREAIFKAMNDRDPMVREYAARNLSQLSLKQADSTLSQRIIDALLKAVDDEFEGVRGQVYGTLAKYSQHRDLTHVFVKGLSDACDHVRLTSVRQLSEVESDSPFVYNALLDAMADSVAEVRRYACIGLQKYHRQETIDAIVHMLETDTDHSLRALAADSLTGMGENKAFQALVKALHKEDSEDVRLAAVRALGKRRGWQTEEVLLNTIASLDIDIQPVFAWAAIRSLGQAGGTERSLILLSELAAKTTNSILASVIEYASRKIQGRIDELRQLERQLEAATPLTIAIPSEYREDVVVLEDEPVEPIRMDEPLAGLPEDDAPLVGLELPTGSLNGMLSEVPETVEALQAETDLAEALPQAAPPEEAPAEAETEPQAHDDANPLADADRADESEDLPGDAPEASDERPVVSLPFEDLSRSRP